MADAAAKRQRTETPPPGCLMMGTGEYTTGISGGKASESDKSTGVVAVVCLDLRQKGKLGRLGMCGTNGTKLPVVRAHMQRVLGDVYEGIDPSVIETFPADGVVDRAAFKPAAAKFQKGDCAIIFTPDDTHFEIAMECIKRGMHVLITKPPVKTLDEHRALIAAAEEHGVLVQIEVHKRFDPIYADVSSKALSFCCASTVFLSQAAPFLAILLDQACDRIQTLGNFSHFTSYMSQVRCCSAGTPDRERTGQTLPHVRAASSPRR
eukprot:SAG22_NODE_1257_length_4983_cov_2.902968_2_plen_264_part_00